MRKVCLSLVIFVFAVVSGFSQMVVTGSISGTVTDVTGAVIGDAQISVSGSQLMGIHTVKSQADGSFLMDQLPPGSYNLDCTRSGFKSLVEKNIQIPSGGFVATLNLKLDIGEETQSVEVQADTVGLDVKSSSVPTTFSAGLLQNIPSGRDPWSTVTQVPGVTSTTFDVAGNQSAQQSNMSVHGSKPGEQTYSFDGLVLASPTSGSGTSVYLDYDSFQEFQVVTDAAPPEVPVGGTYMDIETKSGSNEIHGLASAYYLTNGTQAALRAPTFVPYGTTGAGTPILNAGSPFVMSRDNTANIGGPIFKDKWWIFGAFRNYDFKSELLSTHNLDGSPGKDPNHQTNVTVRSDFQAGPKDHVNVQWLYNQQNRFFKHSTTYAYDDQIATNRQIEPAYIVQGQWTRQMTNNLTVDFRIGKMHLHSDQGFQPGDTAVSVADKTLSTLTGAPQTGTLNQNTTNRFAGSASYFRGGLWGPHNFKGGAELSRNDERTTTKVNGGINVYFNSGVASQVYVYDTPVLAVSMSHTYAWYLQDAWTIKKKLTVNYGMRFDHFRSFLPAQCNPAPNPIYPPPATRCSDEENVNNWNNLVPRISASYDPTGKGQQVFRASYNRFILVAGTSLADGINKNGPSGNIYTWSDTNHDGIAEENEYIANLTGKFGGIATTVDPNLQRPYSETVNFGYQREVFHSLTVSADYYWRSTKRQISQYNTSAPTSDYTAVQTETTNPLTGTPLTVYNLASTDVGKTSYLVTNIPALDQNHYNGVELKATKRFNNRWQALVGFTIQSEVGTYSPGPTSGDFNDPNQNINRVGGHIDQDAPYVFRADTTYIFPLHLSASLNYQHETGYPLLPTLQVSTYVPAGSPPGTASSKLLQGTETINLAPDGRFRLDSVNDVNLRLSRPTPLRKSRFTLEPMADFNNILNANPVVARTTAYGSNFLKPSNTLNPFVARFGLKVIF
jgi:hypothetical protein